MPTSTIIVLTSDIIAIIIMGILLYALLFENSEKDLKTKYFSLCCMSTIVSLGFDIPAWIFENKPGHDVFLYFVNIMALIFSLAAVGYISYYEIEIIGNKDAVSPFHAKVISLVCLVTDIVITIGAFTGKTFSIKDGVFTYGPWYAIAPAVSFVILIYMEGLAVFKRKYLGLHNTIAFLSYMVMPITAVIIETLVPELSLALSAAALSSLLLYVMLQSGHVSTLHLRGELLKELSYKDMLTDLGNRRAYDLMLDNLNPDRAVNFIFCDVNGLKYVNDKLGHVAGDEMLKRFSDILRRHFSADRIFRISGDEFVVIIPDLPKESFMQRLEKLRNDVSAENDIAATGFASGLGKDMKALLSDAEERMYENKKESYVKHPERVR